MANLTALTDPMQLLQGGAKTNITYDALNRLTGYHAEGVTPVTFAYDVTGNLTQNGDAAGAAYTYGGAQPHAVTQVGTRGFEYDANGNLIEDGQRVLTWNAANQLAQITLQNGTVVHHTYDHTGARVSQRVEAVNTFGKPEGWVTYWFSEALEVRVPLLWPAATSGTDPPPGPPGMAEPPTPTLDVAHATATVHVLIDGQRIASRGITGLVNDPPADPTAKASAEFLYYHHADHLGSSHLITEGRTAGHYAGLTYPKGSVVQRFEHAAFGQESFALNPNLPLDPRFTGQTYDVDTGLYYFRARYYDPVPARFISPDSVVPNPTHPQSYNRYAYVRNNPLRFTDPTGHYESPEMFGPDPVTATDDVTEEPASAVALMTTANGHTTTIVYDPKTPYAPTMVALNADKIPNAPVVNVTVDDAGKMTLTFIEPSTASVVGNALANPVAALQQAVDMLTAAQIARQQGNELQARALENQAQLQGPLAMLELAGLGSAAAAFAGATGLATSASMSLQLAVDQIPAMAASAYAAGMATAASPGGQTAINNTVDFTMNYIEGASFDPPTTWGGVIGAGLQLVEKLP